MTDHITFTAADIYAHIATAFVSDPALEKDLLADLPAAVEEYFGITLPKPAALARTSDGFVLTYDGQDYDLGDPRTATKGELNDAELELVSAGGDGDCATYDPYNPQPKKVRYPIQPNAPTSIS